MNRDLFLYLNSWVGQYDWLDLLMIFWAEWLGYLMIVGVVCYYLKNRGRRWDIFVIPLVSAFVARFLFVEIIRFFYYNPRPFLVLGDITVLLNHEASSSFPSGHATFYFALAMGVYLYNKNFGYVYFVLAGLMGLARVFVSVHWPLDILAGVVLGILTSLLVYKFYVYLSTDSSESEVNLQRGARGGS